jgi:hypothetical protein
MLRRNCAAILKWIFCLALCLHCAAHCLAQVSAANVAGVVEDSTGARIPDASVKLINVLTGTENASTTNRDGVFLLPGVIPGTYTLQIERQGFSTAQITGLALNIGYTRNLLIRLKVGSVTETVEIDATGITLNTADASISTTVGRDFVADIPLNGRSFQDLITMTPGVLTQSPQAIAGPLGASGNLSVNGQRTNTNYFLVDGVSGNFGAADLASSRKIPSDGSTPGLTAIGTTQSLASIDALEEFRVLSSSYSAEYGTAPGGQFMLATRSGITSGSKAIHGSFYNYRRYNASDAIDWYQGFLNPKGIYSQGYSSYIAYHQNDFGGTLGIPVVIPHEYKGFGKTYIFTSFEEVHLQQPTAFFHQYNPSQSIHQEAPGALQVILNDFPAPRYPQNDSFLQPYVGFFSMPGNVRATSVRLDHALSPRVSAFFRYSDSPSNNQAVSLDSLAITRVSSRELTFGAIAQLSAMRSNDFRLGFARSTSELDASLSKYYGYNSNLMKQTNLLTALGVPESYSLGRGQVYIHIPGIGESTIDVDHASSTMTACIGNRS